MTQICSFKEYISNRFYDELYSAAENIINKNWNSFNVTYYKLNHPEQPEVDDIHAEHVWVNDEPGMGIQFDVAVSVSLTIRDRDYHYDREEEKIVWIMVRCRGDLNKKLDDFEIFECSPYDGKKRQKNPLDDSLVPYISAGSLEQEAGDILKRYYPEALKIPQYNEKPIWVDPRKLTARLNLSVIRAKISPDCSIFGQIYFEPATTRVYNRDNKHVERQVQAGTILADLNVSFLRGLGALNNTIVHECVHWIKHRKAFALARLYNTEVSNISCEVAGGAETAFGGKATEFMEMQANQLAPRIQMPAAPFKAKANEYISKFMQASNASHTIDVMEQVIEQLQVDFSVSKQAAKIRLVELGFEDAMGTFIYLDGHYVQPHSFKKGACRINQTFSISSQDAAIQRHINPELYELTESGDYLFVDNHFVYYTPLYVQESMFGNLELTEYARSHMDECCLLFDMTITSHINGAYHSVCYLNRESSDITFEVKFHNGYENAPPERQVKMRQKMREEEINIRKQMTDDPEQCMKLLLKWRRMDYTKLGDTIERNPKTISRIAHQTTQPDKKTAVRICLGLHLPPLISEKLLEVLNCRFIPTSTEDQWMREALAIKYPGSNSIEDAKEYLALYGVKL